MRERYDARRKKSRQENRCACAETRMCVFNEALERGLVVVDDDKEIVRAVGFAASDLRARAVMDDGRRRRTKRFRDVIDELERPGADWCIQARHQYGAQAGVSEHKR